MAQLRTLTVNLVDLNLQTDVINGASVEISLERTATSDSFAIVPTLSYSKTSDATGILTFRILPNNDYTRYRAKVVATSGQQVLDAFFVMPDGNRALATLLQLSVYPDGFNNTVVTTGYATQFQVNGEDVGTPDLVETLNIDMPGATKTDPDITGAASVHLPYSGQFRDTWDMSSGSTGPAAPLNDYQATHTGTTITPDPHLVSPYYVKLSAAYSDPIQLQSSGTAQASIVVPDYTVGDNLMYVIMAVTNSSATAEDLEASIDGSQPANPIWTSFLLINPAYQQFILGHNNNDDYTSGVDTGGAINSGDTAYMDFDFSTGNINVVVNGTTYGPSHLDLSGFPPGDGIKLFAGMVFSAANTVFAAGNISVNFSDTTGGGTGFSIAHDATLPTGALDNDWYEVSAGGYFHGKTTRAGQFVKLIRGKTDLIVADKPADQGTSTVEAVTVTHFSDINTTGVTDPRLYVVTADETNANQRTQYLFDGSALMWLVALEA